MNLQITYTGSLILLGSAIYHLVMGGLTVFAHTWALKASRRLYKLQFPEKLEAKYDIATRYLGAFGLSIGIISWGAWRSSESDFKIWTFVALALLFILRAMIRLTLAEKMHEAFSISAKRNLLNVCFNFILVGVMLLFGLKF